MGIPPEIAIAKNGGILKNSRFFRRQVSATSGNDNNIASAVFLGLSRIRAFLLSALRFRKDEMTLPAAPPDRDSVNPDVLRQRERQNHKYRRADGVIEKGFLFKPHRV